MTEKFNIANYYRPYKNNILIKWEVEDERNGIIIPDSLKERKLGLEVVAVGEAVLDIKIGDIVVPIPSTPIGSFPMLGKTYAQIADYQVFAIISKDYEKASKEYKKQKEEEDKAKIELIK